MTKTLIALSAVAALATTSFASTTDVDKRLSKMEKKIKKLEKKLKKSNKKLNMVKAHDFGDNIKWDVDFRSTVDKINYKLSDGTEASADNVLANRLLLNMKFKADERVTFYGTLANNKTFGDTANHSQSNTNPGYADFDWVTNENMTDDTMKVKEAYWLYANDTFMGKDMPWTASIGRRPSTGGLGINYREGDKRKSAIASTVNIEFDGISLRWNTDQVGGPEGSWFKICAGRGITNANPRFTMSGTDYANNTSLHGNSDMIGLIVVPFDNGQYSFHTNYAKASHMVGFDSNGTAYKAVDGTYSATPTTIRNGTAMPAFQDVGDFSIMTAMFKAEGIGEEINDFLDATTFFASYSRSVTSPKSGHVMLGSPDSKTGNSIWLGAQMPCPITEDGRFGIEWNKGSKYWRSMTYGEDTVIGSKIAARGTALEFYWFKPLTPSLTLNIRHTSIKYDYTGSNSFFGAEGVPMTMAQAQAQGQNPVKEATDTRFSIRYRF